MSAEDLAEATFDEALGNLDDVATGFEHVAQEVLGEQLAFQICDTRALGQGLGDAELKAHKAAMEVGFQKNAIKKGQPGFEYDKPADPEMRAYRPFCDFAPWATCSKVLMSPPGRLRYFGISKQLPASSVAEAASSVPSAAWALSLSFSAFRFCFFSAFAASALARSASYFSRLRRSFSAFLSSLKVFFSCCCIFLFSFSLIVSAFVSSDFGAGTPHFSITTIGIALIGPELSSDPSSNIGFLILQTRKL